MKSYSDEHSDWHYDWPRIIDQIEAGELTTDELREARSAARSWVTCACGNLCRDIPRRDSDGRPEDDQLAGLGVDFYCIVACLTGRLAHTKPRRACAAAREILQKIEARAAVLLSQEGGK